MSADVTRASLLSRVKNPADEAAWRQFEALYRDLLVRFCRRRGLQEADADDVVQTVMTNLVKCLPGFAYDPGRGRFRDYLFRCTDHAIARWAARPGGRDFALGSAEPGAGEGDGGAETTDPQARQVWEDEWMAHHYRLAMRTIRETFEARSVEIFDRSIAGETVARLAAAFGMSEDAVHKVRQRIKRRMEELIAAQVAQEDDAGDR
jgi:RNA polymerase sigma-70 factor (ECF subfamily)